MEDDINYIIDRLDDIENLAYNLKNDIENLEKYKVVENINNTIIDVKLFKEKLIQNGLYNDKLNDFIDEYIKFYNKE